MNDSDMNDSGMKKPVRKPFGGRDFYLLLVLMLSSNMVLWLDSFDRYLSGRYHFYLSQYLPDAAYAPSRSLEALLKLDPEDEEDGVVIAGSGTEPVAQPVSAPVAVKPASAPALAIASAPALAIASAPALVAASGPAPASPISAVVAAADGSNKNVISASDGPRILFAGDSMMQGVAPFVIAHMRRIYPKGLFVDASKESTGLTVRRYFDWPARIREACTSQGLDTLVIFLGPNDPWNIYEHRKLYVFPSDNWKEKYRSRVDEVLDFAAARGLRVIWVGLPVMRDDHIEQGAKVENAIFQEETKKYKFEYLPAGEIVGPVDQPYRKYIDDPKKGRLVVRANDGVHFTSAGLRMISSRIVAMLQGKGVRIEDWQGDRRRGG